MRNTMAESWADFRDNVILAGKRMTDDQAAQVWVAFMAGAWSALIMRDQGSDTLPELERFNDLIDKGADDADQDGYLLSLYRQYGRHGSRGTAR